jgi:hypothetical protein
MNKTDFVLTGIIVFCTLSTLAMVLYDYKILRVENEHYKQSFEMYKYEQYAINETNQYVLGLAYCSKDILLIDIKDREYWEALETFNHEWQHCHWPEHFEED